MSLPSIALQTSVVPSSGLRVVSLVRVSTEAQAAENRAGLERQREVIRRTVKAKGLTVVGNYELTDVSGTSTGKHPAIREILKLILDGKIDGIVLADLDRLFRPDRPENYAVLQTFQDMGAKIYSGDFEYDLRTKDGLLFGSIRAAIAGFELSLIKERQQGAIEQRRKLGKLPTPAQTIPLGIGYNRDTDSWCHTSQISRVQELFRLFDEEGIRNYSELGRRIGLQPASVKCILRNPIYTGWRVISQRRGKKRVSKSGKTYREKINRPAGEVIRNKVLPSVISDECFARVQAEMERTKFTFFEQFRTHETVNLGTGVAICGKCGQPLFCISGNAKQRSKRDGYYQCKANHYAYKKRLGGCKQPHLRNSELDKAIHVLTSKVVSDHKWLARTLEASEARRREVILPLAPEISPTELISDLRRRDERLLSAFEKGAVTLDELRTRRAAIRQDIEAANRLAVPKPTPNRNDFFKLAKMLVKGALRVHTLTDKKQIKLIVNQLFAAIHVRDHQIVSFKFTPSSSSTLDADSVLPLEVLLSEPLQIGTPPEVVPEGHRRCIDCGELKTVPEHFYRMLNQCNPCRSAVAREAYLRRRARANGEDRDECREMARES